MPLKRADQPVPVLVTIPNDNTDYAAALGGTAAMAQTELSMWYHGAGNEVESNILNGIIDGKPLGADDLMAVAKLPPQPPPPAPPSAPAFPTAMR